MKRIFTRVMMIALGLGVLGFNGNASSLPAAPITPTPDAATVKASMESFKSLSHRERKDRLKEVKAAVKDFKAARKHGAEPKASTLVQVIVTILLPPLGVYLHEGEITSHFWISLLLTLLFYVPGLIYSLIIVLGD